MKFSFKPKSPIATRVQTFSEQLNVAKFTCQVQQIDSIIQKNILVFVFPCDVGIVSRHLQQATSTRKRKVMRNKNKTNDDILRKILRKSKRSKYHITPAIIARHIQNKKIPLPQEIPIAFHLCRGI